MADVQLKRRAKRVIDLAYDESLVLGNQYIGTEHILLGLIGEGEGAASRTLAKLGVDLKRARSEVSALKAAVGPKDFAPAPDSRRATTELIQDVSKRLRRAEAQAVLLNRQSPGLEHLVLAIMGDENSVADSAGRSAG